MVSARALLLLLSGHVAQRSLKVLQVMGMSPERLYIGITSIPLGKSIGEPSIRVVDITVPSSTVHSVVQCPAWTAAATISEV